VISFTIKQKEAPLFQPQQMVSPVKDNNLDQVEEMLRKRIEETNKKIKEYLRSQEDKKEESLEPQIISAIKPFSPMRPEQDMGQHLAQPSEFRLESPTSY
jgi:hypothetical protein